MYILSIECPNLDAKDLILAELWENGTTGVVEDGLLLMAFFDEKAPGLAEAYDAAWEEAEETDWVEVSRRKWEPLLVGERFFVVPAWRDDATPEGRIRIEINSGPAFGTGSHETTQMCMEAMERVLRPGSAVFDLGTGSGILATAAAKLGAGRVFACDIDPLATETAAERLRGAGVEVGLFTGSVRAVRSQSVDLALANINAEALTQLAAEIVRVLAPGGRAIVTGFDEDRMPRVLAAFEAQGLKLRERIDKGDWVALIW